MFGIHWWQSDPPGTHAETQNSFRLVLVLLLTRAVLVTIQHVGLGGELGSNSSSGSSSSAASPYGLLGSSDGSNTIVQYRRRGLEQALELALVLFVCIQSVHLQQSSSRGCLAATQPGVPAPAAAAAATNLPAAVKPRPKRLTPLPEHGLPVAVAEQLSALDPDVAAVPGLAAARPAEEQVELLQKLAAFFQLVLRELPLPVGCNNPSCVNMDGVSEIVAAARGCSKCRVTYYCCEECLLAHWDSA